MMRITRRLLNPKNPSMLATLVLPCLFFLPHLQAAELVTDLFLKGYSVVPAPRQVELSGAELTLDDTWTVNPAGLDPDHIAVRVLVSELKELFGLELKAGAGGRTIRLSVAAGAIPAAPGEVADQAYRLTLAPDSVDITGNADAGLFYGVQTLLQLSKQTVPGRVELPVAQIEDWPSFKLRFLHFDTKHHQDRIETVRRYLDWAARFKINMISYELEDKFSYPSHPVIGAPGAFTPGEFQSIVDYGLERFIQVVPNVQAPAHFAYVLKHDEFAHLRADGNNYQSCLCNERTYELIFSMYDDLIRASKGIDYFHVSTDEVYYAGICASCEKEYNPENRSLKWVEFAQRAHEFLAERGRKMICWVEYPLLPEHISLLPPDIIDGVLGNEQAFIDAEARIGIRQLAYTSMQGSEYLFPNYWSAQSGDFRSRQGRLASTFRTISVDAWKGNPIGVFGAAWGDSGLHNETFWLGWATVAQYGWTDGTPSVEQHVEDFMNAYYGPGLGNVWEIYQGLQRQARFFQRSWDRVVSRTRGSGYGNSYGPGRGVIRRDDTLPQPATPRMPGLDFVPVYTGHYGELVDQAEVMADEAQSLIQRIMSAMSRARRNRYNLEVLLSIARLTQHHDQLVMSMGRIEENLESARRSAESNLAQEAVEALVSAYRLAAGIVQERKETYEALQTTWEKSRYRKGGEVEGRRFVHILDDTKDHWADRRPDLSYLIAPEESIQLEEWMKGLETVLREYAANNGVDVSSLVLEREPEE